MNKSFNQKNNKKTYLLLVCLFSLFAFSQEKGFLNHFQRKFVSNTIILPNDSFNPKIFSIGLPRELYDSGEIQLLKPVFISQKFKMVKLNFKSGIYSTAIYCLSHKKEKNLETLILSLTKNYPHLIFEKKSKKRLICYSIKSKENDL